MNLQIEKINNIIDINGPILTIQELLNKINYEFNSLYIDKFWDNITDDNWIYINYDMIKWIGYSEIDIQSSKRTYSLLIKSNFEELLNGKKIKVYFYVPYQLDFYKFTVEKVKMTEKELFIKVAIDIDILKPFISNTYITYNIENKKIIYYEGISIINNSNGRSYFIKHNYFHNE